MSNIEDNENENTFQFSNLTQKKILHSNIVKTGQSNILSAFNTSNNTIYKSKKTKTPEKRTIKENIQDDLDFPYVYPDEEGECIPLYDPYHVKKWYYPKSDTVKERKYQFSIVKTGLLNNTLICLPTGLGKTFIASTIIYNYYKWFPESIILFMAPSKPLVNQQIVATLSMVGVEKECVTRMTGEINPSKRAQLWKSNKVFFVTPHIVENDIKSGICPAKKIVLCIVDEAHKATGRYPACEAIKLISKQTPHYRIIALTATPGSNVKSIQKVIYNLLISKIEIRTESSNDVKQFLHNKKIEEVEVDINTDILKARQLFLKIVERPIKWLQLNGFLYNKNPSKISSGEVFLARKSFQTKYAGISDSIKFQAEAYFGSAISLYHGLKVLDTHGLLSFKNYCDGYQRKEFEKKVSTLQKEIVRSKEWSDLMNYLNEDLVSDKHHPKIKKLTSIMNEHFKNSKQSSKVIIFTEYRDSVEQIVSVLSAFQPLIRPISFVGQSKNGLNQKKQIEVIEDFKKGTYNTLIATCIGEEGLDIGEVDLIICYDAQTSPIRMIQRMGRTGRKREGKCIILLTKEEKSSYKKYRSQSKSMYSALKDESKFVFYDKDPRMLPGNDFPELEYIEINGTIKDDSDDVNNVEDMKEQMDHKLYKKGSTQHTNNNIINELTAEELDKKQNMEELDIKQNNSNVQNKSSDEGKSIENCNDIEDNFNVFDEFFMLSQESQKALIPEAPKLFDNECYMVNTNLSESKFNANMSNKIDDEDFDFKSDIINVEEKQLQTESNLPKKIPTIEVEEVDFDVVEMEFNKIVKNQLNIDSNQNMKIDCMEMPIDIIDVDISKPINDMGRISPKRKMDILSGENADVDLSIDSIHISTPKKKLKRLKYRDDALEASVECPNSPIIENDLIQGLIEEEAEVSGESLVSDDEEEEECDENMNLSFVVDDQLYITPSPEDINMKSIYLRSLSSQTNLRPDNFDSPKKSNSYKLKFTKNLEKLLEHDGEGYDDESIDNSYMEEEYSVESSHEEAPKISALDVYKKAREQKLNRHKDKPTHTEPIEINLEKTPKEEIKTFMKPKESPFKNFSNVLFANKNSISSLSLSKRNERDNSPKSTNKYPNKSINTATVILPVKNDKEPLKMNNRKEEHKSKVITIDDDDDIFLSIDLENIESLACK